MLHTPHCDGRSRHKKYLHDFILDRVNDSAVPNSVAIVPCKISFEGFNIRVRSGSLFYLF
ncbi:MULTISPECIES: hypothetical protein [Microcoleaceae]|uniref:hypothetical protein n=1 Tax=Microcoleaceae TaxID=1892252 RepID=UPI0018815D14|nr:hypothetical protein [Tychonema sp. LEGE 06208]MBE9163867.1 hypothetical protein [Tychonema sp. LEGE 06208]